MRNKKYLLALVVLAVIVAGLFLYFRNSSSSQNTDSQKSATQERGNPDDNKIRIIATGDLLPHDSVNLNAKTSGGYDYKQFFEPIKKHLDSADVIFCNQESPSAPGIGVSGFPAFNAPPEFAEDLSSVGCNVISLANNHLFDKGQDGIDGTRQVWDELNPLAISGANRNQAEQDKVSYFEIEGVKFAFVAFSEISNQAPASAYSLNFQKESLVNNLLGEADKNADFVIVSAHWGTEYSPDANSNQIKWAENFAEHGADFVFGHGPHVVQPVRKIKSPNGNEAIVFYSLGNLLSTQLEIESLIGGLAVIDIDKNTKKFDSASFYPTYMHYEWTPEEKAREDLLKRKNLKIYPLTEASGPLSRSQNNTTPREQVRRLAEILNKYIGIDVKN